MKPYLHNENNEKINVRDMADGEIAVITKYRIKDKDLTDEYKDRIVLRHDNKLISLGMSKCESWDFPKDYRSDECFSNIDDCRNRVPRVGFEVRVLGKGATIKL